jgi:diaminopimelate epimerase
MTAFHQLSKHHGLGNDFLVLLEPERSVDLPALARAACDRHRGVGADGLLVARRDPLTMELYNADGGVAEMSGNGIRCFAQAVVDAGWQSAGGFDVVTGAGVRAVVVSEESAPGLRQVSVDMGTAKVRDHDGGPTPVAAEVDTGNPHLVLLADDRTLDLDAIGAANPHVNVEIVTAVGDGLVMEVFERGVGRTLACGTGSVAAAAAARSWGIVGDHVVVHNPGGDLAVDLQGDEARLIGPTQFIARVELPCR